MLKLNICCNSQGRLGMEGRRGEEGRGGEGGGGGVCVCVCVWVKLLKSLELVS